MEITLELFVLQTGKEPENDNLERCNCERAGQLGHYFCGWNAERNLPRFMTAPLILGKGEPYDTLSSV